MAVGLFGVPIALRLVGTDQVAREVARIRTASAAADIDMTKMLAPVYDADAQNPVAAALGIDRTDVQLQLDASGWCAQVIVRRLLAQDDVFLTLSRDGALSPVRRCPERVPPT